MTKIKLSLYSNLIIGLICFATSIHATPTITTHFNNLLSISCDSTAQRCFAVGMLRPGNNYAVYSTQDGGNTWSKPITLHPPTNSIASVFTWRSLKIQCNDSAEMCLIAGSTLIARKTYHFVYSTHNAGLTWSEPKLLPKNKNVVGDIIGIACSKSGDQCILLNEEGHSPSFIYTTQDAGQTWSNQIMLPISKTENDFTSDISCSGSGLTCTVVGGAQYNEGVQPISYVTTDGGFTWSAPTSLEPSNSTTSDAGVDYFSHIHCNNTGLKCIALRYQEITVNINYGTITTDVSVYTTLDGRITWQKTGAIDNSDGELYEPFSMFSCDKNELICVAISSPLGTEGSQTLAYITSNGGQNWTKKILDMPTEPSFISAIFCDDDATICQLAGMRDPYQ